MKDLQKDFDAIESDLQKISAGLTSPLEKTLYQILRESIATGRLGNYPVAAAVVDGRNNVLSLGVNRSFAPIKSSWSHAEMEALNAFEKRGLVPDDHKLLVTLEPCLMCTSRILLSGIKRVEFLTLDPDGGATKSTENFPEDFRNLAKDVSFTQIKVNPALISIGQPLYEIGERVWKAQLGL